MVDAGNLDNAYSQHPIFKKEWKKTNEILAS